MSSVHSPLLAVPPATTSAGSVQDFGSTTVTNGIGGGGGKDVRFDGGGGGGPRKASTFATFANITKAIVGAGSFALPYAFSNMGLVGGCFIISLSGLLCYITCIMIVDAKTRLVTHNGLSPNISYVDVGRACFGTPGSIAIYLLTLLSCIGGCGVYMQFVGQTLSSIYSGLPAYAYMFFLVALELPLVLQGSAMKILGYTSLIGDLCLLLGMGGVIWYAFEYEKFQPLNEYPVFSFATVGKSFGSVAFLFCVNFLIFPIQSGMKKVNEFPKALGSSMVVVTIANAGFGLLG